MKLEKDILEIIKDVQDINNQITTANPSKQQLQMINLKAKAKFPIETAAHEMECSVVSGNPSMTTINAAPIALLLDRLPFYKSLYLSELRKKCEEAKYLEILKEYKI